MKKFLLIILILTITSCSKKPGGEEVSSSFPDVVKKAENTTVRFIMWGGSVSINRWVDSYVAPEVMKRYKIKLVRIPADASIFVNKLLSEKRADKQQGTMDLIWINGENFKNAKENGLLWGPVADRLPNFKKYVNPETVRYDFGYPVEGYEVPYGRAQFVFEYDSSKIKNPPDTYDKLKKWIAANPGKMTYPRPPDFTGSAFIRQVFYATTGGYNQFQGEFSRDIFDKKKGLWLKYLNEIAPSLWNKGKTYPKNLAALDTLFERGEVLINMTYHQANAQNRIIEGRYPNTVRTFAMKDGSIYNTHFTAIPFNSPNKEGAMVVANFLLSPEAQLSKNTPTNWGDFTALDMKRLESADREKFTNLDLGKATVPISKLEKYSVPEVSSDYLEALESEWEEKISAKK